MYDQPNRTPRPIHSTLTTPAVDDWRPLADICRELGVPARRGARWAQKQQDASLAVKCRRAAGGSSQWWLGPEGTKAFRIAMLGEPAVHAENRRLITRLYESGLCLLSRCFPR